MNPAALNACRQGKGLGEELAFEKLKLKYRTKDR
jgi:hypothetical protein